MHFTEYSTRIGVYAVMTRGDRLLLTWYNGEGAGVPCWSLPGGGVEFDERLEDALVREVYEETGYVVTPGPLLAEHHFTRPATVEVPPIRSQRLLFGVTIVGGALGTTEVGGSTDYAEWVRLRDVPELPVADVVRLAHAVVLDRDP